MPKQRITKEMIVAAAFDTARASGMEHVMVKTIANKLHCSVQPIYSYCENMEGLRQAVVWKVKEFIGEYMKQHIDPQNLFQSSEQAYIQLAKDEPHLYKIFILHERKHISTLQDLYEKETSPKTAQIIAKACQLDLEAAKQLHLHMLIYTIGLGTIFAVTTPGIAADEIYAQQESAYQAFFQQALRKKDEELQ